MKETLIERISIEESNKYISSRNDFKNNKIAFFTLEPSISTIYSKNDGWEQVNYFTKRFKKSTQTDGFGDDIVYILSNPAYPGLVKIGHTRKDINIRIKDLSKATGVPMGFKLEYIFRCSNGADLEREVHAYLKEFRPNNYREFFEVSVKQAIDAIKYIANVES